MSNSNKTYRIAVASTDGKTVNEHFGKAAAFFIYEIGKVGFTFIEKRSVTPLNCNSGHTQDNLASTVTVFKDCTAIVVVKIGNPVKRAFEINGISIFEKYDTIDNVLAKLAAYYAKTIVV